MMAPREATSGLPLAEQLGEMSEGREARRECPLCGGLGWFETHAVEGGWSDGPTCHWCKGTGKSE